MAQTNFLPVNIDTRRTAIKFVVALAASALAWLTVAQAGEARVTLKSPTGYSNASSVGSTVKVSGTSTVAGSLVIERLRAPYENEWEAIKSLSVGSGGSFDLDTREPINTKYRATLSPTDGGAEQVSNTVGVWRKWPKWKLSVQGVFGGYEARYSGTLPPASIPDGEDVFDLEYRKVTFYSRFTKPASLRQSYWARRGTTDTYLNGRKMGITYEVAGPTRFRWSARTWWCFEDEVDDPFGSPRNIKLRCPTARKISEKALQRHVAIARRG